MIWFALLLHLVFLASVFDIYFKSPVLPSSHQFSPDYEAPARRLVLIVADGLRADSLFGLNEDQVPFFRKIIKDYGVWGVSHTKVPTESRPGHVALIAGMFEDPSAITRGWRENPVDFDTLFNQSRFTWSWGSPDILPMFAKGAYADENNQSRVFTEMYDHSYEDFSSSDLSQLDAWVFDHVETFFNKAKGNTELQLKLRENKIVLFLHLLGCDTNGHVHKPNSKELLHNIQVLDARIQSIVDVIEKYWNRDSRTTYLFTADHGMTDWGSHGAGLDHETQTPILAWGAGIRRPRKYDQKNSPLNWPLVKGYTRSDVNQTDLSILMAALLGVNMPQNSMGKLPIDFLRLHESEVVKAKLSNVMQIYHQFLAFRSQLSEAPLACIFHYPFQDLTDDNMKLFFKKIKKFESTSHYQEAMQVLEIFHDRALQGLFYYQRYHRFALYVAMTLSYTGFVVYIGLILIKTYSPLIVASEMPPRTKTIVNLSVAALFVAALIFTIGQNAPWKFLIYYSCPIMVVKYICDEVSTTQLMPVSKSDYKKLFVFFALCLVIIESLVMAFFDRRFLSLATALVAAYQSWTCRQQERSLIALWLGLCFIMGAFSFLPTVGRETNLVLVASSGLLSAFAAWFLHRILFAASSKPVSSVPVYIGMFYLILSAFCVWSTEFSSLSLAKAWSQRFAWFVMLTSLTASLLSEPFLLPRLLSLTLGLQSMYLLLSLSYEGFFLLCLCSILFSWLVMEHRKSFTYQNWTTIPMSDTRERRVVVIDDIWRALLFLFFSVVSFFGTGNLASLNSFDPKSIRSLVSVFNPFLMGGLLLLKVLIPFLVVACFVCAVRQLSQMPSRSLFLLLLLFSDLMGLHFFFLVTDRGSWLDIGTSLSHFVIAEATVIFLQIFYLLAKYLMQIKCLIGRKKDEK